MKETLLQRCQREAREKWASQLYHTTGEAMLALEKETLNQIIANTLKQVSEEFLRLIDEHDPNVKMCRETNPAYWGNTLRTDVQRLLDNNETV